MQLVWENAIKVINVITADGEIISFPFNAWSKNSIKKNIIFHDDDDETKVPPAIFQIINLYLDTLSSDKLLIIENAYREAYETLEFPGSVLEVNKKINELILDIFSQIEWEPFKLWCLESANLNVNIGIKDTLSDVDYQTSTYFTEDYKNLICFSVLIKLVMPIWGLYFNTMKDVLGIERMFMGSIETIKSPYMDSNPAFEKLETFVTTMTYREIKIPVITISNDIGYSELPEYMLALVLWKKIIVFDGRVKNDYVVKNMFNFLRDICYKVVVSAPRKKKPLSEDGKDNNKTISDSCNIVQTVPIGLEMILKTAMVKDLNEFFDLSKPLEKLPSFVQSLCPELNKDDVKMVLELSKDRFIKKNFHIPIIGLVCTKELGVRNINLLDYNHLKMVNHITSMALFKFGYRALGELLVAESKPKNIGVLVLDNRFGQKPLNQLLVEEINEQYRLVFPMNPGLKIIDTVIKEIMCYDWDFQIGKFENITNELGELIIKRGKRYD